VGISDNFDRIKMADKKAYKRIKSTTLKSFFLENFPVRDFRNSRGKIIRNIVDRKEFATGYRFLALIHGREG